MLMVPILNPPCFLAGVASSPWLDPCLRPGIREEMVWLMPALTLPVNPARAVYIAAGKPSSFTNCCRLMQESTSAQQNTLRPFSALLGIIFAFLGLHEPHSRRPASPVPVSAFYRTIISSRPLVGIINSACKRYLACCTRPNLKDVTSPRKARADTPLHGLTDAEPSIAANLERCSNLQA